VVIGGGSLVEPAGAGKTLTERYPEQARFTPADTASHRVRAPAVPRPACRADDGEPTRDRLRAYAWMHATMVPSCLRYRRRAVPDAFGALQVAGRVDGERLRAALLELLSEDGGVQKILANKARAGVRVRILLGDPDGRRWPTAAPAKPWPPRSATLSCCAGRKKLLPIGLAAELPEVIAPSEAGAAKPNVKIFHQGCARFRLAPVEVAYVGDGHQRRAVRHLAEPRERAHTHGVTDHPDSQGPPRPPDQREMTTNNGISAVLRRTDTEDQYAETMTDVLWLGPASDVRQAPPPPPCIQIVS
jgi:hypothetical protein